MGLTTSGLGSSKLGFRGTEDLGNGLTAGFHLEGQIWADDGNALSVDQASGADTGGFTFERRAGVSLGGGFGTIFLGRDYAPTFMNTTAFDPFGTNGVGAGIGPSVVTAVRYNNSIGYFFPQSLGNIYGHAMYAMGEQSSEIATGEDAMMSYFGARVGFKMEAIDVAVAFGSETNNVDDNNKSNFNVGGSYDLGVAKPMALFATQSQKLGGEDVTLTVLELGVTAPAGPGTVKAAYNLFTNSHEDLEDWTFSKIAVGYVLPLSKRTFVYGNFATIANGDLSDTSVSATGLKGVTTLAGEGSSGWQVGINHSF